MYLRHTTLRKDGKVHRYWRLVRSVRVGRKVVQQTVAHLGELDAAGRARALARAIMGDHAQPDLFDPAEPDATIPVRLKGIRLDRGRTFGDVWLGWTLWRARVLDRSTLTPVLTRPLWGALELPRFAPLDHRRARTAFATKERELGMRRPGR